MKKAMIYAYTAQNLGDDLFIYLLADRYQQTQFTLYAPRSYQTTFSMLENIHVVPNDRWHDRLLRSLGKLGGRTDFLQERSAKQHDIGIYIGGSLFMETKKWQQTLRRVRAMRACHRDFFILGANFGPYRSATFVRSYEAIFNTCTDICFRERKSQRLFAHLPHIRYAPDIVFQLPLPKVPQENKVVISVIFPSLRDHLHARDENYFTTIKQIAMECLTNDYEVVLMAFCLVEKDDLAVKKIYELIPEKYLSKVTVYYYDGNFLQAIETIASSKAVIATRFHAMIIGWVLQKHVYPIVYSAKMENVIKECQFPGPYADIRQRKPAKPFQFHEFMRQRPFAVEKFIIESEKQFSVLDQFLR